MRTHVVLLALSLSTAVPSALAAQGAMRVAPSGRATTEVTLTFVDSAARAAAQPARIRIDYGQPHLRGRALHTGNLVPYDQPWRTGANDATTLTTDVDLVLGGTTLAAGRYVLHTLPGREGWKLLVRRDAGQTPMAAAMTYDESLEVARIDLRRTTLSSPIESLTIWLIPATQPGSPRGELRLAWGDVSLATDWSVR